MIGFITELFNKVVIGLIAFYGVYEIIQGRMTLGSLAAIMVYLGQLAGFQSQCAGLFQVFMLGAVSCERVAAILDEKEGISEAGRGKRIHIREGAIEFQGVSFGYRQGEYILKEMSFSIAGGRHIALVGPSGSGKTTILLLILRLYNTWGGRILIDREDSRDVETRSLRNEIGISLQEPFLWNDSIANNIKYGNPAATDREVIEAARIALADDFIKNLPSGYSAMIGENACTISEGQKEKVAIARAIVKMPKLLLLDEAMSSIDSAGERRIVSNIKDAMNGATLVTVSHRLSTVMSADLVYYLSGPGRMEIDTPHNMRKNNSRFSDLFRGQENL
jgi:ABC-type multidrug transport system fused ATPase/permease subunit